METKRIVCTFLLGLLFCAITLALPLAGPTPLALSSNIAGTALVSYALGPLAGGIFGACVYVALSCFGLGDGVIGFVVLTRFIEGAVPGLVDKLHTAGREHSPWLSPLLGALALTLLIKPLGSALAWLFGRYGGDMSLWAWLCEDISLFFRTDLQNTAGAYTLSCAMGWTLACLMKRT